MDIKATVSYEEPIFLQGYRITFVKSSNNEIIGVLIEGPRLKKPLYLPKTPGAKFSVKLPEQVKKLLVKYGFNC